MNIEETKAFLAKLDKALIEIEDIYDSLSLDRKTMAKDLEKQESEVILPRDSKPEDFEE